MCINTKVEKYIHPNTQKEVEFVIPCCKCDECKEGTAIIDEQLALICASCLQERIAFHPVNPDNPIVLFWVPEVPEQGSAEEAELKAWMDKAVERL